jgi:hypothetical protein
MASEPHDWTVPAPLRALLWWPPIAFVMALLDPSAAVGTIAAAGAALAVLGVLVATVGGAVARRFAGRPGDPVEPVPAPLPMPGTEAVAAIRTEQRAA